MTTYIALPDSDIEPDDTSANAHFQKVKDNPIAIAEGNSTIKYEEESFGGSPNAGFNQVMYFEASNVPSTGLPTFCNFVVHRSGYYKIRFEFSIYCPPQLTCTNDFYTAGLIDNSNSNFAISISKQSGSGSEIKVENVYLNKGQNLTALVFSYAPYPTLSWSFKIAFGVSDNTLAGCKFCFAEQIPNDATQ